MAAEGAPPFFAESIVFLAATVVAVPIAKRLGLGSVVGYLAAGAAIGPHGLQLLGSGEDVLHVAELGVVLLLFVIGLELDPQKLWRMKRDIFGLGTAQVVLTGITLFGIGRLAGYPFTTSLIAGFGLALSSTAFALQILQERGQLSSAYGQRAFGILLLQDIAIVPLLAMVAVLAPGDEVSTLSAVTREILIVSAAVAAVRPDRSLSHFADISVACSQPGAGGHADGGLAGRTRQRGHHACRGLSMALGAFLAGVLLAESSFRHTLEADIEPFRSLLMGLFFVAVGMSLNVALVMDHWGLVASGVVVVMGVKGIFLWGLSRGTGSENSDAMRIAVTLPQGGEFAFVLFTAAISNSLLDYQSANLLNAIVILTMLLTPLACLALDKLAVRAKARGVETRLSKRSRRQRPRFW